MLRDRSWSFKYTSEDGDLVRLFHIPALEDSKRYDRLTGYFHAEALALAARGIEGLVRNEGRMRLVVGCTLEPPEIEAIARGEELRRQVERRMTRFPLIPPDAGAARALELLAWMVERGFLDVKIAVPGDADGKPIPDGGIFHEKTGIIEDRRGDRLAWTGSLNETGAGWRTNWESISVFTSWWPQPERVEREETNFARMWAGQAKPWIVMDVPDAVRRDLLRFLPPDGLPERLETSRRKSETSLRMRVWGFIQAAPARREGGARIGEATAPVRPWPHQMRAFERLYGTWPPRLLIADEVGLGKTIQAGMLLRQAWLAGRARRILILAPKAVLGQWQIELREKFNLAWPIYDGGQLSWQPSPARKPPLVVGRDVWRHVPVVIASSQLMRRRDRAAELLRAARWDLVVLDEAHHARRSAAGGKHEGGPNNLLQLMQGLKDRTDGLVLLTATPMQVHPVEVWGLLDLLRMPPEWEQSAFLAFFEDIQNPCRSSEAFEMMARLFCSAERVWHETGIEEAEQLTGFSRFKARKVLRALRDTASIPRRKLDAEEREGAIRIMRTGTPVRHLISRNTRELLRRYFRRGVMKTPIAERRVEDRFLDMTGEERAIYQAVEGYIAGTYQRASKGERAAVGFVMTVYRRRIASSFAALRETLQKRRAALAGLGRPDSFGLDEDLPDDDLTADALDAEEAAALEQSALAREQEAEIDYLLDAIGRLPPDSKLGSLKEVLRGLRRDGKGQVMVFTQFTDTMDFLRDALLEDGAWSLLCFSGRGGEAPGADGGWRDISRDDAKRWFRDGKAEVLLCTEAAAEGLNFQFCGAVVNYDMPWNPMRVEQRIGRIDRLGQKHKTIRIVNLHYEGTVETDIYRVLRERINLFQTVVGRLQPILSRLPGDISKNVLEGRNREELVADIERAASDPGNAGFDIDAVTEADLVPPKRLPPAVTMEDLDRIIQSPDLMPSGFKAWPMGRREYELRAPGRDAPVRVTTDPKYFEEHSESLEFWSPGNPLFPEPEFAKSSALDSPRGTLKDILDGG